MIPLVIVLGSLGLLLARPQDHFGGHSSRQSQTHFVRQICFPQQWINAAQPHIVGQSESAQTWLLSAECSVTVGTNADWSLPTNSCLRNTAFVQQHQLWFILGAHIHCRRFQFLSNAQSLSQLWGVITIIITYHHESHPLFVSQMDRHVDSPLQVTIDASITNGSSRRLASTCHTT